MAPEKPLIMKGSLVEIINLWRAYVKLLKGHGNFGMRELAGSVAA